LAREIGEQVDLLVGERAHLLAVNGDRADQPAFLEHRHADERARARELDDGGGCVLLFLCEVGDVDHLFCFDQAAQNGREGDDWIASPQVFVRAWGAMESNHPQLTVLEQHQIAELGLAERDCLEMTPRTSEVAVCCSSDSLRSSVRCRSSLSSRVFSMAMTAWESKFLTSSICFSVNGRTSVR